MAGALLATLALATLVVGAALLLYLRLLRKQRWAMKALLMEPQMPHSLAETLRMNRTHLSRWLGNWKQKDWIQPVRTARGELAYLKPTKLGSKKMRRRIRRSRIISILLFAAYLMVIDAEVPLLLASAAF